MEVNDMGENATRRFDRVKTLKRDYWSDFNRPILYKITPLILVSALFVAGMVMDRTKKSANTNLTVDGTRQVLTRGQFPDLTPFPAWADPLYDDNGVTAEDAFLLSPARSMAARDSPLPVHSHMSRYDVTYDPQQQDMINRNLREQFGRWR